MTSNPVQRRSGGFLPRWMKSKRLVILTAFAAGLLVFGLVAASSSILKYLKLSSQDAMLRAAPDAFHEGSISQIFTGPAFWPTTEDITAEHPAFLMGAISALFPDGSRCKTPEQVNFKFIGAYCRLSSGTLAVESNMMPQLLISVASNKFSPDYIPIGKDGKPLKQPEPPYFMGATSYATVRYSDASRDQPHISDEIMHGMTAEHLADISRNGGWTTARAGLGFRKCYASKDSTGIEITCYRG